MDWMFVVIQVIVAGWLAFTAIKGTSRLFHSPYVKKGMEEKYRKFSRIGVSTIAVVMFIVSGLNIAVNLQYANVNTYLTENSIAAQTVEDLPAEIMPVYEAGLSLSSAAQVLTAILLTMLVAVFFMMNRMQDKKKKQHAQVQHTAPRAAFYFDEEDGKKN